MLFRSGAHTEEEMSIVPVEPDKVYFREGSLGLSSNVEQDLVVEKLQAINRITNQNLEIFEFKRGKRELTYNVVLDPPASRDKPAEIIIKSYRPGIFGPLVKTMKDRGFFRVSGHEDLEIELTIVAPPQLEFTSFSMSPDMGVYEIDNAATRSCVSWHARNTCARTFSYTIQARRKADSIPNKE